MDIAIKDSSVFLCFTILVGIHELGHFIMARVFRIRVEKFYIFFDPWFSLFKFKRGNTEYGLGWLPLGGYVKIAGMIDESMDKEQMKRPVQQDEFRAKPAWQRFLVMIAGVVMNVVLAVAIYCGICYTWGDTYFSNKDARWGYDFNEAGHELGFRDGDRILSIDGRPVDNVQEIISLAAHHRGRPPRGGGARRPGGDAEPAARRPDRHAAEKGVTRDSSPCASVHRGQHGVGGGLRGPEEGRRNPGRGRPPRSGVSRLPAVYPLARRGLGADRGAARRGHGADHDAARIGGGADRRRAAAGPLHPRARREYTLRESIPAGIRKTGEVISSYWEQLKLIVQPKTKMYEELGGFIAIGSIFPAAWDWQDFWMKTAFLSIILAVMNILPIRGWTADTPCSPSGK